MSCSNQSPAMNQAPGEAPITAYHGQDLSHVITFFTRPSGGAKSPQNLTGQTAVLQVLNSAGTEVASFATPTQLVNGGVAGTLTIAVPAADVDDIPAGDYTYTLHTTPTPRRRLTGTFKVVA